MAIGVSSYSDPRGRRRRRRVPPEPGGAGGPRRHPALEALLLAREALARAVPLLRLPATLAAAAHLVLVALLPAGENALLGVRSEEAPGYLTLFQVDDALGYYTTHGQDGFLVFKIYTQDGGVVDGVFPDDRVTPKLRYDRWALAGNAAAGPYPELNELVAHYILQRLPSPPVRLELYAAHWEWDRNSLRFPWPGPGPETQLRLRRLGSYDGLTRTWKPERDRGERR